MDSHEALHYMRDKRALLSNPGLLLGDVYYSTHNTSVQDAEVTYNNGRYTQTLSNLNFNSQSQITIPISSLLSTTYLYLAIPSSTDAAYYTTSGVIAIPNGWGYLAINSMSYLLGSSNVSQIQVNGQSLLMMNLEQCETAEKRIAAFFLGGSQTELAGPPSMASLSTPWSVATSGGVLAGSEAYIVLNYPWSRMSGLCNKLPIDTTLMSNSITITIQLNSPQYFMATYGGNGVTALTAFLTHVNAFSQGQVLLRQGEFSVI